MPIVSRLVHHALTFAIAGTQEWPAAELQLTYEMQAKQSETIEKADSNGSWPNRRLCELRSKRLSRRLLSRLRKARSGTALRRGTAVRKPGDQTSWGSRCAKFGPRSSAGAVLFRRRDPVVRECPAASLGLWSVQGEITPVDGRLSQNPMVRPVAESQTLPRYEISSGHDFAPKLADGMRPIESSLLFHSSHV